MYADLLPLNESMDRCTSTFHTTCLTHIYFERRSTTLHMNTALTCVSALALMLHTGTGWTLAFMPSFNQHNKLQDQSTLTAWGMRTVSTIWT